MIKTQTICFCLKAVVLICCLTTYIQGQKYQAKNFSKESISSFRYIIFDNELDERFGRELTSRYVAVLMDAKAFNEDNLKILFSLISKRFPAPKSLYIEVFTNLEQTYTPEEKDSGGNSDSGEPARGYEFDWAVYIRTHDNEFFSYGSFKKDIKTVDIIQQKKDK